MGSCKCSLRILNNVSTTGGTFPEYNNGNLLGGMILYVFGNSIGNYFFTKSLEVNLLLCTKVDI